MCIEPIILFNRFDFPHGYRFVGFVVFKVVVVVVVVVSIIIILSCSFWGWGNMFKVVLHVCFFCLASYLFWGLHLQVMC